MAKQKPVWILRGMDAPPPAVNGYEHYGVVFDPARDARPTRLANLASDLYWALWSYSYWGKKVRAAIELRRAETGRPISQRAVDTLGMAAVVLTARLYARADRSPLRVKSQL